MVNSPHFSFQDHYDGITIDWDNGIISLLYDGNIIHEDYWRSFGFHIYDSSRAPSVVSEALEPSHLEVTLSDNFQPCSCEESKDLNQKNEDL